MLVDFGCRYVIVGHSERRALYGESDAQVARKFIAAQGGGLLPILCVGESLQEREQGVTEKVVARQLDAVIEAAGVAALAKSALAYEPVWAIGTGVNATPGQAAEVHGYLRGLLSELGSKEIAQTIRILYGGSVKAENADELLAETEIDGALVGGASLSGPGFIAIVRKAARGAASRGD